MALSAFIFIVLLITVLVGLYMLGGFRQRRAREPPLDKGLIPWLGYAREFRKDASIFLKKMQERHGDIFTVQFCGQYVTFVTDVFTFDTILKENTSKLDFSQFARDLVFKIFDFQAQKSHRTILKKTSTKYLMGTHLNQMTEAMMYNLKTVMQESDAHMRSGTQTWKQEGLFQYCYNTVFRAGYLALFGTSPANSKAGHGEDLLHSQKIFEEFRKFDILFPKAMTSLLLPKEKQEMRRLKHFFWNFLSEKHLLEKDNVSAWIQFLDQQLENLGMPKLAQSQYNLVLLWASQGNTGTVSFWTLLFLLKNPKALKAVKEEAERVLKETRQDMRPAGGPINIDYNIMQQTPVLDSVMEEILRMVVAPFLSRSVIQDMILKMDDGREYALRQGDVISIFPHLFLHMDPEIHPDPTTFKYDRFLNADGSRKTDFYKQGRRVKSHILPWGAGTSLCPGRFFALNEMKLFVFFMLTQYDLELVDPEVTIPPINVKRWGIGAMQPIYDIQFRYRIRL